MRAKAAPINTEGRGEPARHPYTMGGHVIPAPRAAAGLHLATPIGNRGQETLADLAEIMGARELAKEKSGDGED